MIKVKDDTALLSDSGISATVFRSGATVTIGTNLIDEPDWHELDGGSAKTLIMLWLIADGGELPPLRKLAFRLRIGEDLLIKQLDRLKPWIDFDEPVNCDVSTEVSSTKDEKQPRTRLSSEESVSKFLEGLGVSEQVARDWYQLRKSKKSVVTKTVIDGVIREARIAGLTLEEAMRMTCERSWQGFKASWCEKTNRSTGMSDADKAGVADRVHNTVYAEEDQGTQRIFDAED